MPETSTTSTIGSQPQERDSTNQWQKMTTQPWAPHPPAPEKIGTRHPDKQQRKEEGGREEKISKRIQNAPFFHHTNK